ncbi:Coiled-coil domain-containing protein 39 [Orchesella cincta]|uniref:Coiled-coil domain-containing protein 39 n=1 Tax=Orchesella cincta TaxID=48709 RepID=A0A1D2ND98_ORCCI|nr:Coiled-coil domain-containing protein 39 [Orchesella cincta]
MTDTTNITAMLKQLGWGSGFRLPIANAENRKLEHLLEMKQTKLVQLSMELQEETLAVNNAASFHKNLQSKMKHTKDVEAAKRGQFEKEKNFIALTERDRAKTEEDVRKTEKRLRAIKQQNRIIEGNVVRRKDALAELVDIINFDKTAITAYEEKFSKEDAYIKLIDDFGDTDNEKIKKCQDEYQFMGEKIATSRHQLNMTISETDILDNELEALAKRFRKAHTERNQFIENWKTTLQALENRDEEIVATSEEYHRVSVEMKKKLSMLERQEAFLQNVKCQTKTYLNELTSLERRINIDNKNKRETESSVEETAGIVREIAQYILQMDRELRKLRMEWKNMPDDDQIWKEKVSVARAQVAELQAKYDVVTMESLTSNEHTRQLDEFLENESKRGEVLTKEMDKQITWKSQREMQKKDILDKVFVADSQVRNVLAAIDRMKKQCDEKTEIFCRFQTVAYRLDLRQMELIAKVNGLENPETLYSTEDYDVLQRQVSKMRDKYAGIMKTQVLIKTQSAHCDNVETICRKETKKETEQNIQFELKLHKLHMELRRIGKEGTTTDDDIKDTGLTNSLLQVQLRKMLHSIQNYEQKMFSLEQERVTLNTVVKARKKDIETYSTLLLTRKRTLKEDLQKLRTKAIELRTEAQFKKTRYEMMMSQMWKGSDEKNNDSSESEGSGRSEAYYIIKLAQEREFYRQEGDKWDERVKEAEKIVEGLQNTLALMIGTNEAFKDSLKPATATTVEGQKLDELKQQGLEIAYKLRKLKTLRNQCTYKLEEKRVEMDSKVASKAELEQELLEKQYELQGVMIEISGQKEKIKRATQQANKLVRELSQIEALDAELLQNDLRLRVTKEKYEFAISTLERLLSVHPTLVADTLEFLHAKGMENLADRITKKMFSHSPSLSAGSGSPAQSGRSTPHSGGSGRSRKGSAGSTGSRQHPSGNRQSIGRLSTTRESKTSKLLLEARSTQKSIIFAAPTSAPHEAKLLRNIAGGLQQYERRSHLPPSTLDGNAGVAQTASGAISFGELRKALQEAVADQQTPLPQLMPVQEEPENETEEKRKSVVQPDEEQQGADFLSAAKRSSQSSRSSKGGRVSFVHDADSIVSLVDKRHEFDADDPATDDADPDD